ncbi:histidinol-phosphate transaminase [Alicyclobacillus sp. SO9]|uniref:histidinol-phosphate transaminase n=1 Tax=Alicyclobacillus sp. SO9 TaxID=2665646 RepID=UPI0018E7820C|nr:histidinol-phosphate transaminase [Alicyclobacillus sp. SO9]QQE77045.1 histidinol-phosphate transaminase [Alicyclobacillus sp. SO9]
MTRIKDQVRPGIEEIQPYVPGITDDELRKMYGLKRVVKLNANENALGPSPKAIAAIQEELTALHHYPDGSSELVRQAIAAYHTLQLENVLVGNGSDEIIKLLSETFLNPGDEVVSPKPSFSQYGFGAAIMGANVIQVPLNEDFSYDVQRLLEAVTERTKMLYLCTPNNPTGTILTASQADWLLSRLPKHVVVVMDLAYNDYSVANKRFVEYPELFQDPRVVVLHTFSKLYGLAGLRVGYGLAHTELWEFVNRVREPFNVNRVAQRAAVAALKDESHRRRSQEHVRQSREFFSEAARGLGIGLTPTEANFALLNVRNAKRVTDLLMEHGVMVRAGFGLEDQIRVTFGTEDENQAWLEVMQHVLAAV